jgi:uncharacterized SAM-binding protein YcdF (DUF218 family)
MFTGLLSCLFLAALLPLPARARWAAGALGLTLFILAGTGPLSSLVLDHLQTDPPLAKVEWRERNVIIVIGFGTLRWHGTDFIGLPPLGYGRVLEAARLYHDCKERASYCKILASGGDPSRTGVPEADVMARDLAAIGIPLADVLADGLSSNTYLNAQFSRTRLESIVPDRVILVTSGFHLRRAVYHFGKVFPGVIGAPADRLSVGWSLWPNARNLDWLEVGLHELIGIYWFNLR